MSDSSFERGERVQHQRFGVGVIVLDEGATVVVRFDHGIEACQKDTLVRTSTLLQNVGSANWDAPLKVLTRVQALAIESVNDTWGVLSSSRIDLLPHQLWVCRRVLEAWPARWLVADDVGLGKTIEAGLILWPLIAKSRVRRLLVICPASLVLQWQYRLRTMFDIRLAQYATVADTPKSDFFNTYNQLVAPLETLRFKPGKSEARQMRLLESEPWDLVIVDEAHRLNADEKSGPTLGYELLERMVAENRVGSMVFFTGTPHRGKNYAFLSLLKLLRPELFDPEKPLREHLPLLRSVMIRNNKQNATDLQGNKIFHGHSVANREFAFSDTERRFYQRLTHFIETGQAYASGLDPTSGKAVQLVLVAIQKLASSSVAAIRRALRGRLERIVENRSKLNERKEQRKTLIQRIAQYERLEGHLDIDDLNKMDEEIAQLSADLRLMENEEPQLKELITLAEEVQEETKIKRIIEILEREFAGRSVLFFTEYKATQSLLMSALNGRFGDGCVTFINGDDRAEDVVQASGNSVSIEENREDAVDRFNAGEVRFLVSTEAGGEGIDLQENCYSMIHVDLPWNPMRLHQRVGRLDRYGQSREVEVILLRNPETVEARLWDKLLEKMNHIMLALGHAMEEPEDLLQLVLGMASPSLWRELFASANSVPDDSLSEWFDQKTGTLGGRDAVDTVRELVGNCAKFDFHQVSPQLPRIDLPALRPFFVSMLKLNGRRVEEKPEGLSFKTPDQWRVEPGMMLGYEGLVFDRSIRSKDGAKRVLGVGHKLVNQALRQAKSADVSVATLSARVLKRPLLIFRITDRVTGEERNVRSVVAGVEIGVGVDEQGVFLKDSELLERLNAASAGCPIKLKDSPAPPDLQIVASAVQSADAIVRQKLDELDLPFNVPDVEPVAVLWPRVNDEREPEIEGETEEPADLD